MRWKEAVFSRLRLAPDSRIIYFAMWTGRPIRATNRTAADDFLRGNGCATLVTADAIRVPVVDDRGTLSARAADASWVSHRVHPDSQAAFSGEQIPGFQRAAAMCEKLHDESPFSVLIGWDLAIDPSGAPILMEWNEGAAAIAFAEASLGPCFKTLGWEIVWRKLGRKSTNLGETGA